MFASDAPFDPEGGPLYIRETIRLPGDTRDVERGAVSLQTRELTSCHC